MAEKSLCPFRSIRLANDTDGYKISMASHGSLYSPIQKVKIGQRSCHHCCLLAICAPRQRRQLPITQRYLKIQKRARSFATAQTKWESAKTMSCLLTSSYTICGWPPWIVDKNTRLPLTKRCHLSFIVTTKRKLIISG